MAHATHGIGVTNHIWVYHFPLATEKMAIEAFNAEPWATNSWVNHRNSYWFSRRK